MSYAVYKTEAIVLRSVPQGEANLDVVLLTRDLGKITVRAQAARRIESKMRMQLARYRHVVVDVVRGRSVWRLTGIHQAEPRSIFADDLLLRSWHRIARLAEFLIQGEEAHPELFAFLEGVLAYVDDRASAVVAPFDRARESDGLELFGVVRVLRDLGYWQGSEVPDRPTTEILLEYAARRRELVARINESIEATQIVV